MKTLNTLLNNELNLYLQTWNAHWNVEGPHFAALHELFGRQYEDLAGLIDEIAERIRALGGRAETRVSLEQAGTASASDMLKSLEQAHTALSQQIRQQAIPEFEKSGDTGTVDLLTRAVLLHDKAAWMLRASGR